MTLRVEAAGPGCTIQDAGRFGWLRFGVTPAGPMDPAAMRAANRALGNEAGAAAVEVAAGGLAVFAEAALAVAFAGGGFRWTLRPAGDRDAGGALALPAAARLLLRPGDVLAARAGVRGSFAILAVPGGLDVPPVMGSRATHLRSGLGGLEGRALRPGDRLAAAAVPAVPPDDAEIVAPWLMGTGRAAPADAPIRRVLGPQDDHFAPEAVAAFLAAAWTVSARADRMAYALQGPAIPHRGDFNIVSDGVALGAVQVAGDGQPLVMMADRQPTGGYPKIGHVARADIGRLAQLRPGERLRFAAVTAGEAARALIALENRDAALAPLRRLPGAAQLGGDNLIGGVIDARRGGEPQP